MYIYLSMSIFLFLATILGLFFSRSNLLIIIISLELILLACSINFIVFSWVLDDFLGQIYTLLILTVAAAESSIGLAIIIVYFRIRGGIATKLVKFLKS